MTRAAAAHPAAPTPARRRGRPAPPRRRHGHVGPGSATGRAAAVARGGASAALDRLFHGPVLIGLVFVLLVGIVFANVTLLASSRQITRDAARVTELKRANVTLRQRVAELGSSERVQQVAAERGLFLPAPDEIRYLRSNPQVDAQAAAEQIDADAAAPEYVDPAYTYSYDPTTGTP